ncbi:MAG TPA: DUF4339 domain-containing protein [Bacteroidia bacterium]|nr:DUF4339 domain-containing protein [Bacteroidia bacterium]
MKKYFIHDGGQQIGPLSIEELKSKDITRSTKVWYEGLEEWKSADSLDDLKVLFTSIPPPLRSDNKLSAPPPIKKKKSIGKIIVWFLVGIVIAGVALVFINNPNAVPGVKILINTPKPIVVTSRANDTGTDCKIRLN